MCLTMPWHRQSTDHQPKPTALSARGGLAFFGKPCPGAEMKAPYGGSAARPRGRLATSYELRARARFFLTAEWPFGHFALEIAEFGAVRTPIERAPKVRVPFLSGSGAKANGARCGGQPGRVSH